MRILVVEDERRIARAIKEGLEQESYAVDIVHDGEEGYNTARTDEYDLIILDVMLPSMNGNDICKKLRDDGSRTIILMLTAKDQDRDIVAGLDSGADDYLAKPFSFDVLLARIRALLRRPHETLGEMLQVEDLTLDPAAKKVTRGGTVIQLSAKEFAILEYMMRNPGRILSKNNIMTHVWDFDADILPNTVEVFITYLRAKIDKPFTTPPLIQTVRGFGYRMGDTL
ncbi:MAG TPA: response regulator transcription factor [Candidatus Saccharibacteria bacterium]|nr:response regulator transcription factor [Candidatus Saccharibacteria bacterium]HMR38013.1 response regulator transcription factor [Candidatus Saccharibacteria bacterium]